MWNNQSFGLGRAREKKQEHPFLQALAALTEGLRDDDSRLHASSSLYVENEHHKLQLSGGVGTDKK